MSTFSKPEGSNLSTAARAPRSPLGSSLAVAATIFVSAAVPLLFLWHKSTRSIDQEMRATLQETALSAALLVDGDLHSSFTHPDQESGEDYQREVIKLRRFLKVHHRLAFLYTMVLRGDTVHFVLDAALPGDSDGDGVDDHSYIMDVYDDPSEELFISLREGVGMVDKEAYQDQWGTFISGYAPVYNSRGEHVAIVGADVSIEEISNLLSTTRTAALLGLGLALLCSMAGGSVVWRLRRHTIDAMRAREIAERRHRRLYQQSPIGILNYNRDLVITECNQRALEISRTDRETFIGRNLADLDNPALLTCLKAAIEDKEDMYVGSNSLTSSSQHEWIELRAGPARDAGGQIQGGIATFEDVSSRHLLELTADAEKKLLLMIARGDPQEELLRSLTESIETLMPGSLCSILLLDEEKKHLQIGAAPSLPDAYNDAIQGLAIGPEVGSCGTAAYTGTAVITSDIQQDPLWRDYRDLAAQHDLKSCWAVPIKVGEKDILGSFAIYNHSVGVPRPLDLSLMERSSYLAGIAIQRSQFEHTVSGERNLLRTLIDHLPDIIVIKDRHHRYLTANRSALKFLNVEREELLTGKTDFDLFTQEVAEASHALEEKVLGGTKSMDRESEVQGSNGTAIHLSTSRMPLRRSSGDIIGLILIARDITQERNIEEDRIKTQKLESLGVLAGGIAHDFNNILTSILGNLSFVKHSDEALSEENDELLKEAETATHRAKDLTQQLLTFAKGGLPVKTPACIQDIVEESATFALRGSSSRLELEIEPDMWFADVDAGQIGQVVQNLVFNADQAMPGGGTVRITGRNTRLKKGNRHNLKPGSYVTFTVSDTGIGIPKENLQNIFDPYFSTKEGGSGLGLTTTFSIILKHDGHIDVESEPGKGSSLTFFLPALPEYSPDEAPARRYAVGVHSAHVLLMDDEEAIIKISGRILRKAGHRVSTARDGEEALRVFKEAREQGTPVEIAILDLTIPGGMGGLETLKHLRDLDPGIRVIVSSGYSVDEILARPKDFGFDGVVAKPYYQEELINAIETTLTEAAT